MSDFIKKLKDSNMLQIIYIGAGIIGVCIILIVYFAYFYKGYSYDDIKKKMINAADSYCEKNCANLFDGVNSISIPVSTLVDAGYMKDLTKLTKDKDNLCSGEVIVKKGFNDYNYISKLDCGKKYHDTSIMEVITSDDNYVTSGNGLYSLNDTSVYRGDNVNNYIKLNAADNILFRIVKVNNDGSLLLILNDYDKVTSSVWDDRYNSDSNKADGINDYSVSRAKDKLEKLLTSSYKDNVQKKAINYEYCVGSRKTSDNNNDGSIECSNKFNSYISLISVYDIINASLDSNCTNIDKSRACINYNYLDNYSKEFWTLTTVSDTSNMVYKYDNYNIEGEKAKRKFSLRFVFTISGEEDYKSGNGSEDNPYILY